MTLNIKKQLGLKIKKLRQAKGYSQEQFAEAIGIAPRTLCFIENGRNFLTAVTLEKILEILEISPEELFMISQHRPSEELKSELLTTIRDLKNCEQIEIIYKVVQSIVKL